MLFFQHVINMNILLMRYVTFFFYPRSLNSAEDFICISSLDLDAHFSPEMCDLCWGGIKCIVEKVDSHSSPSSNWIECQFADLN